MHIQFATALVVAALASAVILLLNGGGERIVPIVAVVAAGIEALIKFEIISLSSGKVRLDVILPVVLLVSMGILWARASAKSNVTAATAGLAVGLIQVAFALKLFE